MRIAYVLTSLGIGGAERQALGLAEHMLARGHEVEILCLKSQLDREWYCSLPVTYLGIDRNPLRAVAGLVASLRFVARFKPNLLHSHSFHANMLARLLKGCAPRVVVISTIHNVYEGGRWRMLAYRLTDRLSFRTVAVSEVARRRFVDLKAISPARSGAIANGIDLAGFHPDPERRQRMRREMDLSSADEFVWLAVGRIAPAKDYPNLLRAFAVVRAGSPQTQLWIAGDSTQPRLAECIALAASLGLKNAVSWLGLRRDIAALLDAADAYVLASAWEGMPLAVAEAMAMQKPIVATDVGGVSELTGNIAQLVPPRDAASLAEAMLAVMQQSRELRDAIAHSARLRAIEAFSIAASATAWERLYRLSPTS